MFQQGQQYERDPFWAALDQTSPLAVCSTPVLQEAPAHWSSWQLCLFSTPLPLSAGVLLERWDPGLRPAPVLLWENMMKGAVEGRSAGPDGNLNMGITSKSYKEKHKHLLAKFKRQLLKLCLH